MVLIKGAYFVDLTCYKCWCNPKNAWQGYHYVYFRFSLRSVLKVHLWNKGGEREGGGWATDQICVANATVLKHDTLQWQIQLKGIKWAGKNITAAQCRWCICTWVIQWITLHPGKGAALWYSDHRTGASSVYQNTAGPNGDPLCFNEITKDPRTPTWL